MDNLIVAEDNPRDREYLLTCLTDYQVTQATNGKEALELALKREEPRILTDLQMPGMNGVELARNIWRKCPHARLVFWTHYKDEIYVRSLARIIPEETVYGFVLKNNPSSILRRAVDTVFREWQCWIDPKLRSVQARTSTRACRVTDAEYEVLIDIALGLTDKMIAERRYLSRRGVQSRLQSLYMKLGFTDEVPIHEAVNARARAVSNALQRGLLNRFEMSREEDVLNDWLAQRGK